MEHALEVSVFAQHWPSLEFQEVSLIPELIHTSSLIVDDLPAFDDAL